MERVNGQGKALRELATTALLWITCARRPLRELELLHALATKEIKIDHGDFVQTNDIISACAGLVTIDEESNIVRLVHYTTQQYFNRTQQRWFSDAEAKITRTCVTYLSFDAFESGCCERHYELKKRLESNPLYDYASHHWGHHARKAATFDLAVMRLLTCHAKTAATIQALGIIRPDSIGYYHDRLHHATRFSSLHLAAFFGVKEAVSILLQDCQNVNLRDGNGRTPLSWAAEKGHEAVLKLLLDKGANIEAVDSYGLTALLHAAGNRHEVVVKLLIEKGAEIEAKNVADRNVLLHAAGKGHEAIVKLLIEKGAEIEAKDNFSQAALSVAAANRHEAVVKLLLEARAEIESRDCRGWTPLVWATKARINGLARIRLLLGDGAKAEAKIQGNGTPLSWDLEEWNGTLGSWDFGEGNGTPLSGDLEEGDNAIVKLLLEKGAMRDAASNSNNEATKKWW
jgi:ankyrin repeat protein